MTQVSLVISCAALATTVLGWLLNRLWVLTDKGAQHLDVRLDKLERRMERIEYHVAPTRHPLSVAGDGHQPR